MQSTSTRQHPATADTGDIWADHAIVEGVSEDDRALMERLAALEAEVKADAEAQQRRREAAMAKVKEQRAAQQAERDALRERQAALVTKRPKSESEAPARSRAGDVGTALELASKANDVKQELTKPTKPGEKSWVKSALASTFFGPLGWLYAGSFREAAPASAAWLAFAAIASKLPTLLLFPILMVVLPLSGIAGAFYAVQYNRKGKRQRLWGDKKKKELPAGK